MTSVTLLSAVFYTRATMSSKLGFNYIFSRKITSRYSDDSPFCCLPIIGEISTQKLRKVNNFRVACCKKKLQVSHLKQLNWGSLLTKNYFSSHRYCWSNGKMEVNPNSAKP